MTEFDKLLTSQIHEDNLIGVEIYLKKYSATKLLESSLRLGVYPRYFYKGWTSHILRREYCRSGIAVGFSKSTSHMIKKYRPYTKGKS